MLTKEEQEKFRAMLLGSNDIQDLCNSIVRKYEELKLHLESLASENGKLKNGEWHKEEMKKLKEEYESMKKEYYRGFPISEEEEKKINEFKDKYKGQHFGAIGGAFIYQFTPTSIGVSGKIIGPDGKELEFCEIG